MAWQKTPNNAQNLINLTNEFSKVTGYKINIQNHLCFYKLATNNQKIERRKQLQSPLHQERVRTLRNKSNKGNAKLLHWKLTHCWEKVKKSEVIGEIFLVYGLEESITSRLSVSVDWFTESIKSCKDPSRIFWG